MMDTTVAIPTEADIRSLLDEIVDPCSRVAGAPAGISEMGMIPSIAIVPHEDGRVDVGVKLMVTHPFCMVSTIFIAEIDQRLCAIETIASVKVEMETSDVWTPDMMSPEYRARLEAQRAKRRENQRLKDMAK
jgi:metal-sulfur cluster biosynthetic enzyme